MSLHGQTPVSDRLAGDLCEFLEIALLRSVGFPFETGSSVPILVDIRLVLPPQCVLMSIFDILIATRLNSFVDHHIEQFDASAYMGGRPRIKTMEVAQSC